MTPAALIWSPADHSTQVSVVGATATRSSLSGGAWQSARSDTSQSSGLRTVYLHIDQVGSSEGSGPGMWVGVGSGKSSIINYSGSTADGVSYDARGRVMKNAVVTCNPPTYTTGDTVGIQVDFTAKTVKFNVNSGAWSAATDITSFLPDVFVTCSLGNGATHSVVTIASSDWNDFPYTTLNIVAHGDSMTLTGGVEQTYLPRIAATIKAARTGWAASAHLGINGVSWKEAWVDAGYPYSMLQDAPLRVDPLRGPLPNWLLLFAGTNGFALFHQTPANVYGEFQEYIAARIAAGWEPAKIIVLTMLPRTGISETDRSAYNAFLVAGATTYGYQLARLDLDPDIGVAGANLNLAWFQADATHPNDNGQARIAQIAGALIT